MKRERALEVENAELRASLETAVGANAMWKRLYDELRAVIDSRDKAAGFEPLRSETAESKEVCTVAHDDCVLGVGEPNFCPYCEIERLINESEEMRKVRLMLYAERDYARQAARNADAKLAEAETLLLQSDSGDEWTLTFKLEEGNVPGTVKRERVLRAIREEASDKPTEGA